MKRLLTSLAIVAIAAGAWAAYQAAKPAPPPLARFMPPDALLYLEAKDFAGLLSEWNASPQKASWLKSDNYSAFSRSRLFLRLQQAQKEFAAAGGLPPDMNFAAQVAGRESALAIYDIGKLEFVYVTYLPSAKAMQTALWQSRSKFEPRSSGGAGFFVRTDPESKRVVAFATTDDYLVLGTREDLVAAAVALLSGQKARNLAQSEWYAKSIAAAPRERGDLRMVLDLADIAQTPQFRTYWIQQNITETRQYQAGVVDLYRGATQYREERVLLRAGDQEAEASTSEDMPHGAVTTEGARSAADLLKFVPDGAGVYRAMANPTPKEALRLMLVKILTPHIGPAPVQRLAPQVALSGGQVGSESDLETRIDQQPVSRYQNERSVDQLESVLTQAGLEAVLQVASTQRAPNGVFIGPRSVLVLASSSDWNGDAVRTAIQTAIRPGLTAAQLGVQWRQSGATYRLDGLMPLAVATQGRYLFLSDDATALEAVLARGGSTSSVRSATYAAGFSHATERDNFLRLTGLIDRSAPERPAYGAAAMRADEPAMQPVGDPAPREPEFFSENIAGLSTTLKDVRSQSIIVHESASRVRQTVMYEWSK